MRMLPFLSCQNGVKPFGYVMLLAAACWTTSSFGVTIPTSVGTGADLEVSENFDSNDGVVEDSGDGEDDTANARFNQEFRNEFIVLRFDVAGMEKSLIADAALNLIAYRTSSNNRKDQRIWGVNSGVADLNTFDELTTTFSTTPGLEFDGDPSNTQGVVDEDTTFLGHFQLSEEQDPGEGGTIVIDQALLNNSDDPDGLTPEATIDAYLQSLGESDQAVFLIGGAGTSGGQFRIATKEATELNTDGLFTGDPGTFAPTLEFNVVPEPASVVLLGLAGVGCLALLRRN